MLSRDDRGQVPGGWRPQHAGTDDALEAGRREAIKLDPSFLEPSTQLARFLNKARPGKADQVIDEAIVVNPEDRPAAGRARFLAGQPARSISARTRERQP
jgi:hypothetical protein